MPAIPVEAAALSACLSVAPPEASPRQAADGIFIATLIDHALSLSRAERTYDHHAMYAAVACQRYPATPQAADALAVLMAHAL